MGYASGFTQMSISYKGRYSSVLWPVAHTELPGTASDLGHSIIRLILMMFKEVELGGIASVR